MYELNISALIERVSGLHKVCRDAQHEDARGEGSFYNTAEKKGVLADVLEEILKYGARVEFDSSLIVQIQQLATDLKSPQWQCRPPVLHARLNTILSGIHNNFSLRKFMYVPQEDAVYWKNHRLLRTEFLCTFPHEAVMEMIEAGNCIALSRATAAVFHSMRAAEYGLRVLARLVKVKLTDKKKPLPIEYATWDKIISSIKNKIQAARMLSGGPRKDSSLKFYSRAADHCEYMKDIWRNEIAHARNRSYNRAEVVGVFDRVNGFLNLIALRQFPSDKAKKEKLAEEKMKEFAKIASDLKSEGGHETGW